MRWLDTLIPPPVVALTLAFCMWFAAPASARGLLSPTLRLVVGLALALSGAAIAIAGSRAFKRAGTTTNPLNPHNASTLVTGSIYRLTRNPMYVGVTLVLVGFGFWLWWWPAILGPIVFVGFIDRFQIQPEERVLRDKFGTAYADYCARVRRWI